MTPEEFARRFEALMAGDTNDDPERPVTDEEEELLREIAHRMEDLQALAQMRQIIRGIPQALYPRSWSLEQLAEIVGVSPDNVLRLAEAGRLTGTRDPDGWMFGLADVYPILFPDEPAS